MSGTTCVITTGSKLLTVSYGSFLNMLGLIECELDTSSSVWPSGAAFATASVPIVPVAPALLSMITALPQTFGHLVAGKACHEIDRAARRCRDDDRDGLAREGRGRLRERTGRLTERGDGESRRDKGSVHDDSSVSSDLRQCQRRADAFRGR